MGRLITFNESQPLTHLVERIAHGVGSPKGFPLAIPVGLSFSQVKPEIVTEEMDSKANKSKISKSAPSVSVRGVGIAFSKV